MILADFVGITGFVGADARSLLNNCIKHLFNHNSTCNILRVLRGVIFESAYFCGDFDALVVLQRAIRLRAYFVLCMGSRT